MSISMRASVLAATLLFLMFAAQATAQDTRSFLAADFLCTDDRPLPIITRTNQRHYHEVKGATSIEHQVCADVPAFSVLSQLPLERRIPSRLKRKCETYKLVSYTVMCKGGTVSAARFFAGVDRDRRLSNGGGAFEIDGETLHAPFYGSYADPPVYAPLPAGYGFVPQPTPPSREIALPWNAIMSGAALATIGTIPDTIPPPTPAPGWVRVLSDWWPWPQLFLGMPLLAYALIALVGAKAATERVGPALPALAAVCAIGILASSTPAAMPDRALSRAKGAVAAARAQLGQAERDREQLRGLIQISSATGMIEPMSESDLSLAQSLIGTRVISASTDTRTNPSLWAGMLLAPSFIFVLAFLPGFVRGFHYLFVRHPAEPVVASPLRTGSLFPARELGTALRPNVADIQQPPPAYQSKNLFEKARAVKERIQADADIADAAMRRDRARAAQIQAEAELREARRKLPWWRRWLVRW